ncbi:MAG TPA: hypothetical protein VJS91_02590 [Nitrososphaeraceae archaeon]|nr:hypothetical protein [Nitrososphaeraceae archaeon]
MPIKRLTNSIISKPRNLKNYKFYYLGMANVEAAQVFEELTTEDNKLLKQLDIGKKDHKKILDVYALRVNLYKDFSDRQHDPIIKAIIEAKKSVVMSDMGLISAQYEILYNIAKIKLRLDEFDQKLDHIQDQKSS